MKQGKPNANLLLIFTLPSEPIATTVEVKSQQRDLPALTA